MQLRQLITELRRRRVFRAAGYYIVGAWVAVQVASLAFPAIGVPDDALLFVWLISASLFPLVVVFAWFYDISLDGISRTRPVIDGKSFDESLRRADVVLLAALVLVAVSITVQFAIRIEPRSILDQSINPFSIAVLPFDDLSGDAEEQYFVSGMQASLIDGLSRVRNLRITSKVSTLPYRTAGGQLADVASRLGVARIVEGTVLRSDNRVSIALRLHDAATDRQVWSATFEDDLENIMILQARAAQEIANRISAEVTPEERDRFAAARPVNPEAYLAYLRGVFHIERFNPEDMRIAATHFQQAVDIDQGYALGWWGLGKLCVFQAQAGMLSPLQAQQRCLPPIRKALELDPFLPEAHMGIAAMTTWQFFDFETARPHWQRSLELNPSYAEAHMFYSHYLGIVGELEESTRHIELAIELDPFNPFVRGLYSIQLLMRNDFEAAIAVANEALGMAPGYAFGYVTLAHAHYTLGNEDEAIEAQANIFMRVADDAPAAELLRNAYAQDGFESASRQVAEYLVAESEDRHVPPITIGVLFEQAGDYQQAIDWFEIAHERFDPDAPYLGVNVKDPVLRNHPRFQALLKRMKLDYWATNP